MTLYYLTLILIAVSIAFGQAQEGNITNNTCINDVISTVLAQPREGNATNITHINDNISIESDQLQEGNATNNTCTSDIIDLTFQVAEVAEDTSARFGFGKKEDAKQEMYNITISNKGNTRITGVMVYAEMEKDMKFESTRYHDDSRGRLDVMVDPLYFKKETKTKLTWDIATLEPEERKSILIEAYIRPNVNNTNVRVNVTGIYAGMHINACKDNAEVTCKYVNKNTGNTCEDASDIENCEKKCPAWSIPQ